MRHYWIMYQITLSKISLKTVWYPNSLKKNGPPQCGIYTLGQLSKLYVLIRLKETNTNKSQERILLFLIDSIRWYGLKFSNPELSFSCLLYHPTGGYGQLWWPSVCRKNHGGPSKSVEWKVRFAPCIASVAIQAFTKLLFSFSDVLKVTNCTFQEVDNIFCLSVGIAVYDEFFYMCAAEFLCALDVFARHTSFWITFVTLTIVSRSRGDVSSHRDIFQTFGFPESQDFEYFAQFWVFLYCCPVLTNHVG